MRFMLVILTGSGENVAKTTNQELVKKTDIISKATIKPLEGH